MADQLNKYAEHLGSGWSFPVVFSEGNYQVMLSAYEQNVRESIDCILQTRQGERCLEPQFGSALQSVFFRKMDDTLKGEIIDSVKTALLRNEPRITVTNVEVVFKNMQTGFIEVNISFKYNQTNTGHNYVYPFYLNEGTNLKK